jgi:hypothetical protein
VGQRFQKLFPSELPAFLGKLKLHLLIRLWIVGGDLPGFKGLIHMDAEKDIVLLNGTRDAFDTKGMIKGVKKLLFDDMARDCMENRASWRRVPIESQQYMAKAIIQFFPDLTEMYFGTLQRDSFSVMTYIKSPARYKLVPEMRQDELTMRLMNVHGWTEGWVKLQKSFGGKIVWPEVKIMWVLKRSED